jgi:TetR/AcrR family transcriptional repressor of nem operon
VRYDQNHKQQTRKKVVKAAAAAIRSAGPGVGVADIMARAGLTHGGFYAHFSSKEALLAEALTEAFAQGRRGLDRAAAADPAGVKLEALIDTYLSEAHRDAPEYGCPVAALASGLPHQGEQLREAFDQGVAAIVDMIAGRMDWGTSEERTAAACSAFAEMSGALALSRAVSDPGLSLKVLAESRRQVKARLLAAHCSQDVPRRLEAI